jgi:hypothetical protein
MTRLDFELPGDPPMPDQKPLWTRDIIINKLLDAAAGLERYREHPDPRIARNAAKMIQRYPWQAATILERERAAQNREQVAARREKEAADSAARTAKAMEKRMKTTAAQQVDKEDDGDDDPS